MNTPVRSRQTTLVLAAIFSLVASTVSAQIGTQLVVSGLDNPVFVTSPPDDTRLFVVQQNGLIRIVQGGSLLPTPFLDLSSIVTLSGEQGLLGMAFHPNYATNGRFFLSYTVTLGTGAANDTRHHRFSEMSVQAGDPNAADPSSEQSLIVQRDEAGNHNAGDVSSRISEWLTGPVA